MFSRFRAGTLNRIRKMSSVHELCSLFENALHLQSSDRQLLAKIPFDKYTEPQQVQIRSLITVADNLPKSFGELNDTLRSTTYLLGTQDPTEIDAVMLARTGKYVGQFSDEETAQNRHVVRWLDQVQNILKVVDTVPVNLNVAVEREIKEKPKKATKEGDSASGTKPKADAEPKAAAAGAIAGAATAHTASVGAEAAGEDKKPQTKKEKAPKPKKEPPQAKPVSPGQIDLRVGFIQKAIRHPDADSLYVSTIDVGEEEPRTICSGLVNFVPIEDMQQRYIVVFANLKPVKMRGIVSNGMVLCAATHDHTKVEFINPPEGSKAGDKLFFESYDEEPDAQLNPKKKIWEQLQPSVTTTDDFEVIFKKEGEPDRKLVNKVGKALKASTIKQAFVS